VGIRHSPSYRAMKRKLAQGINGELPRLGYGQMLVGMALAGICEEWLFRYCLIGLLMLGLGLRRGEAVGLRWADVDLMTGVVSINNQRYRLGGELIDAKPKSRSSRRRLQLTDNMRRILIARRRQRPWDTYILEGCSPEQLRDAFRAACARAGCNPITLHGLRHTFAAISIAQGGSLRVLQTVMGHASYQVTEQHYAHVSQAAQQRTIEGVGRAISSDS